MRCHTARRQFASKTPAWRSSGHSARSSSSVPPLAGCASCTRTSGLRIVSDERTSRRQFCARRERVVWHTGTGGHSERCARGYDCRASKVALGQEEEDHLRASDVLLERPDVVKIIYLLRRCVASDTASSLASGRSSRGAHVEEYLDSGQQQLQLVLDDRGGVLPGRPTRGWG